jgi:hypothetical protein
MHDCNNSEFTSYILSAEGQLLGKSKWEKPLADWITATGVGLVGQEMRDKEAERVERNDGWRREPFL